MRTRDAVIGLVVAGILAACSSDEASVPKPAADAGTDASTSPPPDSGMPDSVDEPAQESSIADAVPDAPADQATVETGSPDASGPVPPGPGGCNPLLGAPAITTANFPLVDGSTSTFPLDMIIGCELLGIPWEWYQGSDNVMSVTPTPHTWDQEQRAQFLNSTLVHNKTDPAFVNLIQGTKDLIFVASKPSADDLALASSMGVTLEYKPVGLDALVFLLNEANPIAGLTTSEILQIYQGTLTDWATLGWSGPIDPYVRPENSGSQELMNELVIQDTPMPAWPPDFQGMIMGMGGLMDMVASDSQAIGYTVYYFWTFQYPNGGTKMIAVDGVQPTSATIASRTYPYAADVYAVIRTNLDKNSAAYQLRDWLLTPKGQCVVSMSGYVPVAPAGMLDAGGP